MDLRPSKGRLVVAAPGLVDPNFDRTVVLVVEHGDEGALGVVLNRPSETGLADALPKWAPLAASPGVVFVGGPVAPGGAIGLGLAAADPGHAVVLGRLGLVDLAGDADGYEAVRVFAGHAGWAQGQLEGEIAAGGWLVVDAEPADALSPEPEELWKAVLARQRGRVAWFANSPPDPSTN